jgi:hypothetical protein
MNEQIETVIIGAGHAGLIMSYYLSQLGREHVLMERGRVGERWRSERWDSFYFQFPNWSIELPGYGYQTQDPDGFVSAAEIVRFLHGYADRIRAPVRCGVEVKSLQRSENERYLLETTNSAILAKNVIIATGPFHVPACRPASAVIPNDIFKFIPVSIEIPMDFLRVLLLLSERVHRVAKLRKILTVMDARFTFRSVAMFGYLGAIEDMTTAGGDASWELGTELWTAYRLLTPRMYRFHY